MMTYITRTPALNATESRLLAIIRAERWWLPDPRCLSYDDLEALEHLRYMKLIEKAALGGYRLRGQTAAQPQDTPARIRGILSAHGIVVDKVLPCKTAYAWSSECWCFTVGRGVKLGAAAEAFTKVVVDGKMCIVELKG